VDVKKILPEVVDSFSAWLHCAARPIRTCQRILNARSSPREKITQALKLWVAAFAIHLLLRVPAFQVAGIDWKDAGFQASHTLFILLVLLVMVWLLHVCLRLHKIPSRFAETFVMYTALITVYSPVFTLLSYHTYLEVPPILRSIKASGMTFREAFAFYFQQYEPATRAMEYKVMDAVTTPLVLLISAGLLVLFVRVAATHYKASRFDTVSAVSAAMVVSPVAIFPLGMLVSFLLYAFIS
jgi:hypothetical protein